MTKTIIVPLNGSEYAERALPCAAEISRRMGAQVVLMTSRFGGVIHEPERYLQDAGAKAGMRGVHEVVVSDRFVVPGIEVIADEFAEPAICMSTRGHFGVGHWLFGSTAAELLTLAHIPMLFVGPKVDPQRLRRLETVLVCTDGSECAATVMPTAAVWTRALSLRPKVIQVLDPEIRIEIEAAEGDVLESATVHGVAGGLSKSSGANVDWDVLHGDDAADAIVQHARDTHASLIAMATHGRTGWARIAAGSVATGVVHSSPCPVLLVRPDGTRLDSRVEIEEERAST